MVFSFCTIWKVDFNAPVAIDHIKNFYAIQTAKFKYA